MGSATPAGPTNHLIRRRHLKARPAREGPAPGLLAPSKPRYWYAAFIVRLSSSASSSIGLSDSPSPGFVVGTTKLGSVIDLKPGTVIRRRPTFTCSPALRRRSFRVMGDLAA